MSAETVLFDLDGVLTRRDTMAALIAGRLRAHVSRLLPVAGASALALLSRPDGPARPRINRWIVRFALRGLSRTDYLDIAGSTGRRLAADRKAVNQKAIAEASALLSSHRVIVVTASEEHLARTFLDAVGLARAELRASTIGGPDGELRLTKHHIGSAKVTGLRSVGVDLRDCRLYTDSASDLPLARSVARVTLVSPSARSRKTMARHVPSVSAVRW